MQILSGLVLVAGIVAVGLPATSMLSTSVAVEAPTAMARFVNNTPGAATLKLDGEALFAEIATGKVTEYAQVTTDSAVTFSLETRDPGGEPITLIRSIEEGARYTLTAKVDLEGRAALTLAREEQPAPGLQPEW
jgi:hypothetical protein